MQQIPWKKIHALEEEIKALKNINKPVKKNKKNSGLNSLEGILKGIDITEEDIEEAQKKVFDFKEIK